MAKLAVIFLIIWTVIALVAIMSKNFYKGTAETKIKVLKKLLFLGVSFILALAVLTSIVVLF